MKTLDLSREGLPVTIKGLIRLQKDDPELEVVLLNAQQQAGLYYELQTQPRYEGKSPPRGKLKGLRIEGADG